MKKYKVTLEVEGSIEIDEPIEADSYDEAVDIAIKQYGNDAWYTFCGNAEEVESDEDEPDYHDIEVDRKLEEEFDK